MSASSIPTLIKAGLIRGIPPNNDLPLHDFSLLNLTKAEMLHAVFSNLFTVPDVRINTLIWKRWDIFNDTDYTWKVVRSRPECVKLLANDFRGFLCEPVDGSGGEKYRALQLTDTLRAIQLRTNVSLEDALSICEHEASKFKCRKSKCYEMFKNKRSARKGGPAPSLKFRVRGQPYQAEYARFEGLEPYIEDIERLTKAMTLKNKCWVHASETLDFEIYLSEQLYTDSQICAGCQLKDYEAREECLSCYRNSALGISDKYFDILSAGDIEVMRRRYW